MWFLLAALACSLVVPGKSARGAAGQVDPSFGASLGLRGGVSNIFPQPGGKILVVGGFQRMVRLNSDGTLDGSFALPSTITFNSANVAVQPDGLVLLWNGVTVNGAPRSLIRLQKDGTLDTAFISPTVSFLPSGGTSATLSSINAVVVQSTGKIVIAGGFNRVNSQPVPSGVARLLPTRGDYDGTFSVAATQDGSGMAVPGALTTKLALVPPSDRILIGGTFQAMNNGFNTINTGPVAQLNADGSFAGYFSPFGSGGAGGSTGTTYQLFCFAAHPDGRIVIAVGGGTSGPLTNANPIYVFNGVGSSSTTPYQYGAGFVSRVLPTDDGKVLVAGPITLNNNDFTFHSLVRLKADNTLDSGFDPVTNNTYNYAQNITGLFQVGSQIYVGGVTNVDNVPCNGVARINLDGSLDTAFRADVAPGTNSAVNYVLTQPDGKVLIDGAFSQFNGAPQLQFARLNTDGTLDTAYVPDKQLNSVTSGFCVQPRDGLLLVNTARDLQDPLVNYGLTRFKLDGSTDYSFTPNITGGTVAGEAVQPADSTLPQDGNILIWGNFTKVDGVTCNGFARITSAGRLDTTFNGTGQVSITGGSVQAAIVQRNGQILLRGSFTQVNGSPRTNFARLNATGALDPNFPTSIPIMNNTVAGTVNDMVVQSDNKIVLAGSFTTVLGTSRKGIARLKADGTLDPNLDPQADGTVNHLYLQPDGSLLVAGSFNNIYTTLHPLYARLNPGSDTTAGSLDATYNPVFNPTLSPAVSVLPSGQAMVAGQFIQVNGLVRNYVARLNLDGSTDHAFNPGVGTPSVMTLAVQPGTSPTDAVAQRVIVGGAFTAAGGYPAYGLARLRSDGTYDTAFQPPFHPGDTVQALVRQPADNNVVLAGLPAPSATALRPASTRARGTRQTPPGPWTDSKIKNPIVRCLSSNGILDVNFYGSAGTDGLTHSLGLQADGKIVVGGAFAYLNNSTANHVNLGRLKNDGTLDDTFNASTNANATVQVVCVQGDGKIVVGGDFTQVNTAAHLGIARLLADGTLDPAFSTTASATGGPVLAVRQQSDGKLVLGGSFTQVNGSSHLCVARLAADGTLDGGFNPPVFAYAGGTAQINSIDQQADGKLIVAGLFDHAGTTTVNKVARLNTDGSVDATYNPGGGPDAVVRAVALQADGKALLGGDFITVDTYERSAAARLFGDYVLSNYSTADQWRIVNFGSPSATGNAADTATPYNDGVPNLLKYALNLNAQAADDTVMTATGTKGLPLVGRDATGQYLTLTFVRRQASTLPGITYQPQFANDPGGSSFAANPQATSAVTAIDGTWERVVVTDSVPLTTQPRRFARLYVSDP